MLFITIHTRVYAHAHAHTLTHPHTDESYEDEDFEDDDFEDYSEVCSQNTHMRTHSYAHTTPTKPTFILTAHVSTHLHTNTLIRWTRRRKNTRGGREEPIRWGTPSLLQIFVNTKDQNLAAAAD